MGSLTSCRRLQPLLCRDDTCHVTWQAPLQAKCTYIMHQTCYRVVGKLHACQHGSHSQLPVSTANTNWNLQHMWLPTTWGLCTGAHEDILCLGVCANHEHKHHTTKTRTRTSFHTDMHSAPCKAHPRDVTPGAVLPYARQQACRTSAVQTHVRSCNPVQAGSSCSCGILHHTHDSLKLPTALT